MILIATLNVIAAVGVIVMVITPLVWAIRTQHRDWPATGDAFAATSTLATQPAPRLHHGTSPASDPQRRRGERTAGPRRAPSGQLARR